MIEQLRHGFEQPILRLALRHFEGTKNGITVIGTWCFEKRSQPCMVLLDARRPISRGRTIPCIIRLADAWRWAAHNDVGDPESCSKTTDEWLASGALPGSPHVARDKLAVLDTVNFFLRDLVQMPPAPLLDQRVIGDMQVIDRSTGLIVNESEAKTNV